MISYKIIAYPVGVTVENQSFGLCQDNQDTQLSFYCVIGTEIRKIYLDENISTDVFQLDPAIYADLTLHTPGWNIRSLNLIQQGVNKNWYLTQLNTSNMRVIHNSTSYSVNFTAFNESVVFNNSTDLTIKQVGNFYRYYCLFKNKVYEGEISVTSGSDNFVNLQQKSVGMWTSPVENSGYRSVTYSPDSNLIHLYKNPILTWPGVFHSYFSTGIQEFAQQSEQPEWLLEPILKIEYSEYTDRFYLFSETKVYEVHLEKSDPNSVPSYISAFPESYRTSAINRDENSVEVSLVTDGYDSLGSKRVYGRFLSEIDLLSIYNSDITTLQTTDILFTPSLEYSLFTEKASFGTTVRPGATIKFNLRRLFAVEAVLTTIQILNPNELLEYKIDVYGQTDQYQIEQLIGTITLTPTEEQQRVSLNQFNDFQSYSELQYIRLEFNQQDIQIYLLEIFENGTGLGSLWTRNDNVTKTNSFDQIIQIESFWNWETFDQTFETTKSNFNVLAPAFEFVETSDTEHYRIDKSAPTWLFYYPLSSRFSPSTWLFERIVGGAILREFAKTSESTTVPNSQPVVGYNSAQFSSINNDFYATYVWDHNLTEANIYPFPNWSLDLPSLAVLPQSNSAFLQLTQATNKKLFYVPSGVIDPFVLFVDGKLQTEIELNEVTIQISDDTFTAPAGLSERCFLPTKLSASQYYYLDNPTDWFFTEGLIQLAQSLSPTEEFKLFYSKFQSESSLFSQRNLVPAADGTQVLFSIPDLQTIFNGSELIFKNNTLQTHGVDYEITDNKILFQTAPAALDDLVSYYAVPYNDSLTEFILAELELISGNTYRVPAPYQLPDEVFAKTLLIFGIDMSNELVRVPTADFTAFPTNIPGEATIEITTPIPSASGRYLLLFQHRAFGQPSILQSHISPVQFEEKQNQYIRVQGGVLLAYNYTLTTSDCYLTHRFSAESPSWLIKPYQLTRKSTTELYLYNDSNFPTSSDSIFVFKNGLLQIEGLDYTRDTDFISVFESINENDVFSVTYANRIRQVATFDQTLQILPDRKTESYDQTLVISVIPNIISGYTNELGEVNFYYTPGPIEGREVIKLTSSLDSQSILNIVDNNIIELSGFDSTQLRSTQYFGDIEQINVQNPGIPKPPEFVSHKIYENKILLNWEQSIAEDSIPTTSFEYKQEVFFGYSTGEIVRLYRDLAIPEFESLKVSSYSIVTIFESNNGLYSIDTNLAIYKFNEQILVWEKYQNLREIVPQSSPEYNLKYFFKYGSEFILLNGLGLIYSIDDLEDPTVTLITQLNVPISDARLFDDILYIVTRDSKVVRYDLNLLTINQNVYLGSEFKSVELSDEYYFVGDNLGVVYQFNRASNFIVNQFQLSQFPIEYLKLVGEELYSSNSRYELYAANIGTSVIAQIKSNKQVLNIYSNAENTFFANNFGVIYSANSTMQCIQLKINPYISGYFVERSENDTDELLYWTRLTDILPISQYEDMITESNKSYLYRIIAVDSAGQLSIPSIPYNVVIDNITVPGFVRPIEVSIINTFFSKKNTIKWVRSNSDLFGNPILNTVGYKITRKKQRDPFEQILRADCRVSNLQYISSFNVTDNNYLNDNRYALLEYPDEMWYRWNSGRCSSLKLGSLIGYPADVVTLDENEISGIFISDIIQSVKYFPQMPKYLQQIQWENIEWTATTPLGTELNVWIRYSADNQYWSDYQSVVSGQSLNLLESYIQFKVEMKSNVPGVPPILEQIKFRYWVEDVVLGKIELKDLDFNSDYFIQDNLNILFKLGKSQQLNSIVLNTLFSQKLNCDFPAKIVASVGPKPSSLPFVKEFTFPDIRQYTVESKTYPLLLDFVEDNFYGSYVNLQIQRKPGFEIRMDEVEIYRKPNLNEQFAAQFDDNTVNWESDGYCAYKVQGYVVDRNINKEFFIDDHIC